MAADSGTVVTLLDRYEIFPDQPLPEFSHAGAGAFAARPRDRAAGNVFAYVGRTGLPVRAEILGVMGGAEHAGLMAIVDHGVAEWPADRAERRIFVCEAPAGRLVESLTAAQAPMGEDQVTRTFIRPVVAALHELQGRRVFHGAINPANIFRRDVQGNTPMLGDCTTVPPGFIQPVAFETVERGMTDAAARGEGTPADDLYAFGVSILHLLLGRQPAAETDDRTLLAAKIGKGSYGALIGNTRLSLTTMEPVRGLLVDDPDDRWTLDDLELWLSGRRLSPKQAKPPPRASRSIAFGGTEHWNARLLATALAADPQAANTMIERGDLDVWLRRSLGDEEMADRVVEANKALFGWTGPMEARRVSRVVMALDPRAPIRYAGRSVMPDGFGGALAEVLASGGGAQVLAEMITGQLPMFWISAQQRLRPEFVSLATRLDQLSGFLRRQEPGYGLERCLYELNPSMPCISPILKGVYVVDVAGLLGTLERVAGDADRPGEPIDRHIAAFLLSRKGAVGSRTIEALAVDAPAERRCVAFVESFDELQRKAQAPPLPNLCQWVASMIGPAFERYHSRTLRDRLRDEIGRLVTDGQFGPLRGLVGSATLIQRDAIAFDRARRLHVHAGRVIALRQRELENKAVIAGAVGRQAAAIIACLLAALLLAGIVVMQAI
ncbi:MAG: serine/threonine protein kinase [Alphaproteobacteria bacterium]